MIDCGPLAALGCCDLLFAVPLVVVVSLVYAATRYEEPMSIMAQSLRTGAWVVGFMAMVCGVLTFSAWQL